MSNARRWRCPKCPNMLDGQVGGEAERVAPKGMKVVHQCGRCGALLYSEPDHMRELTPAERFGLEMRYPHVVAQADALMGTDFPTAIILARPQKD